MSQDSIVLFGNCQAHAIGEVLKAVTSLSRQFEVYTVVDFPDPTTGNFMSVPSSIMDRCSIFLCQTAAERVLPDFLKPLETRARVLRFPVLYCQPLWPTHAQDSRNVWEERCPFGRYPYGDRVLLDLIGQKLPTEEIVERYLEMPVAENMQVGRLYEMWSALLDEIDAESDIILGNFIRERFSHERIFWTINHPTETVIRKIVNEIFNYLNFPEVWRAELDDAFRHVNIGVDQLHTPIHPSIIDYFGLKWAYGPIRYRHYNDGTFTLQEWIKRYVEFS